MINYFLSIKFVFQSGIRHKQKIEIGAVFLVNGLALLVNKKMLYMAIELFNWHLIFSKIMATATVFFGIILGGVDLYFNFGFFDIRLTTLKLCFSKKF